MKDYKIYIFDFDGTLFDTKKSLYKVYRDAFAAADIYDITDEECNEFMHHNLLETVQMRNVPEEKYKAFGDACQASIDSPETVAKNIAFPESMEVVKTLLSQGKRVAVCSGNTVHHIKLVLDYWKWEDLFSVFMGSDIFKHGKPDPEPINFTLRELGVEASHDIVYVGDSLQDDLAGRAAGIDTILIDREDEYPSFEGKRIHSLKELLLK